jgi:hypothetical protein
MSFGSPGIQGALTPVGQSGALTGPQDGGSLADVLERVLDKGVVIAGDIQINLLDIELLTIKLRLLVASVDTARRMGIRWWETDPMLSGSSDDEDRRSLQKRVDRLEHQLEHQLEQRSRADRNDG